MLREKLLATTFLIMVGSVTFSPAQSGPISRDLSRGTALTAIGADDNRATTFQFGDPGRDRNRDFLCTYGYKVYFDIYSGGGSSFEGWVDYAVPITGKGASVSEIVVTDAPSAGFAEFKASIHEDEKGVPGNGIASGKGEAHGSCLLTTIAIPKKFLAAGKRYWIVESARRRNALAKGLPPNTEHNPRYVNNAVQWGYKPNAKHNALYRSYYSAAAPGSLSDWLPVSGPAPFVKVK